MKYARIALGLCAVGFTGGASAVALNPKGIGQALVYPYYTVNKGQDTLVSVTNVSDVGKVVKLRFREGFNGRTTFGVNLYLSAHDVWTGSILSIDGTDASGAQLTSSDHSCVDPPSAVARVFSTAAFDGTTGPVDELGTTRARTREGFFEIIAIGDIVPESATDRAITHVQTGNANEGTPTCVLPDSLLDDTVAPTSGLTGTAAIINVTEGTFYPYVADALIGFTDVKLLTAIDDADHPTLEDAHSATSEFVSGATATIPTNSGGVLTLDYERGIDAVSAVFMTDALFNEYLVNPALGASTDWVVTFPTRQFYVDTVLYPFAPSAPFDPNTISPFLAQESIEAYDQEELSSLDLGIRCDANNCDYLRAALARQVSVVTIGNALVGDSPVFGSPNSYALPVVYDSSGWLRLRFAFDAVDTELTRSLKSIDTATGSTLGLKGLPATGFMAYNVINANALPGRLANYSGVFRHRTSVSCNVGGSIVNTCP